MSENNNPRKEKISEENKNINFPTFDYGEKDWPANRLYVSELPENATPGSQRKDESQELILKFDWYFATTTSEIQSEEFCVPNSRQKFIFRAQSSPWMEYGKQLQVSLLTAGDCEKRIRLKFTAMLRSPNWEIVKEQSGAHEFDFDCEDIELFSIKGKPVDVWPVDPTTELITDMDLIPRVYAIKGTLKYIAGGVYS